MSRALEHAFALVDDVLLAGLGGAERAVAQTVDRGPGLREDSLAAGPVPEDHTYGLGLWIVQRAVLDLGGTLSIRNRPGYGLSFDIAIPGFEVLPARASIFPR